MKRISGLFAAACLVTVCWSGVALAWGSATHAYLDDRIGRSGMVFNSQELYGSMAADVFNFSFAHPSYMAYLYQKTHTDFMGIWEKARTPYAKALGYGFVSHNGVWGADLTAHTDGLTSGQGLGYVVDKAHLLKGVLIQVPELAALNLPDPVLLEMSHSMVEYGIDILVKKLEPQIGKKVAAAAIFRSPEFAMLLNSEYAGELATTFGISKKEATDFIIGTESDFRHLTLQYGIALSNNEEAAVQILAEQLSSFAAAFLRAYGVTLPDGVNLTPLAAFGIQQAMALCAADFAAELAATRNFTRKQLVLHGVKD
ncbi:hypothetical protein KI809_09770 [Geobacter pelophilus]|uniref:Uncharacterized protein n=1 Tax=Geoanaerobacter pelophilus TaxID=60036 RepID=A0AAW4LBM2_9BACT|nr:hypothetical protein [Geoanaerobacter pelophilus]MBT0664586.1 hypothetical protein [Geoanaerobacter pelophilus]